MADIVKSNAAAEVINTAGGIVVDASAVRGSYFSVDTLADIPSYATNIDQLCYCREDGKYYKWDGTAWRYLIAIGDKTAVYGDYAQAFGQGTDDYEVGTISLTENSSIATPDANALSYLAEQAVIRVHNNGLDYIFFVKSNNGTTITIAPISPITITNATVYMVDGVASGKYSMAQGVRTSAIGKGSHAEGDLTKAVGSASHAEGVRAVARGNYSHAEGSNTQAIGEISHAEGNHTIAASQYQHVSGRYNIADEDDTYAEIIGNGTSDDARANMRTLDWNGNENLSGNLVVNGTISTEGSTINELITAAQEEIRTEIEETVGAIYTRLSSI